MSWTGQFKSHGIVLGQERHSRNFCYAAFKEISVHELILDLAAQMTYYSAFLNKANKFQTPLITNVYSKPTNGIAASQRRLQDVKRMISLLYLQE